MWKGSFDIFFFYKELIVEGAFPLCDVSSDHFLMEFMWNKKQGGAKDARAPSLKILMVEIGENLLKNGKNGFWAPLWAFFCDDIIVKTN